MALTCSLEATFIQQMKNDKVVYLPIIARRDKPGEESFKIIRIDGARQYRSHYAAEKFAEKALRKLWKNLMRSK